jgi:SAM-dependent methyltransferase
MPYARASRITVADPELDQAEHAWWKRYSGLIERIWGMPDELCRRSREPYINGIKGALRAYAGRSGKTGPVDVLEIACGTGWAGRLLSDRDIHVTGVDFSEEQIDQARQKAAAGGFSNCSYVLQDINRLPQYLAGRGFDAIFIHCGIHHLSRQELDGFVKTVSTACRPGSLLVLVEPMYHDRQNFFGRAARLVMEVFYRIVHALLIRPEPVDEVVQKHVDQMIKETAENRWFLSPKEMPFTRGEIEDLFQATFEVAEIEPVTLYALRMGQQLAMLRDQDRARTIGHRWIPVFTAFDELLIRTGLMPMMLRDYLFTKIVLVRKA